MKKKRLSILGLIVFIASFVFAEELFENLITKSVLEDTLNCTSAKYGNSQSNFTVTTNYNSSFMYVNFCARYSILSRKINEYKPDPNKIFDYTEVRSNIMKIARNKLKKPAKLKEMYFYFKDDIVELSYRMGILEKVQSDLKTILPIFNGLITEKNVNISKDELDIVKWVQRRKDEGERI